MKLRSFRWGAIFDGAAGVFLVVAGLREGAEFVLMGLLFANRSIITFLEDGRPTPAMTSFYIALGTGFAAIVGAAALSVHHDEGAVTWNGMMARADDVAIATLLMFLGVNVVHSVLPRMLKRA